MAQSSSLVANLDTSVLVAFLTTFVTIIILSTRLITGTASIKSAGSERGSRPPTLPYWVPFIGHLSNFLYDPESLLTQARETFLSGIFALKLGQYKHIIVFSPSLIKNLLSQFASNKKTQDISSVVLRNVFGLEGKDEALYLKIIPEVKAAVLPHLEFKNGINERFIDLIRHLQGQLPDFVTFNPSIVDQEPWERLAQVVPSDDNNVAEASLLPLTQIFLTHVTLDTLFTSSILSDSDHTNLAPLLLALTQSHALLLTGLPRTLPHPKLPSAHMGRKSLLNHLEALHDILTDEEIQGPLLADRQAVLEKHGVPPGARDADLLALLWNITSPLILGFWLLLHIVSDETLLVHIRKEINPYAKAIQEAQVMGLTLPLRLSIDAKGLVDKCGLFKAAYIETVRLYSRGLASRRATEDFSIEEETSKVFGKKDKWAIQKGEYMDVPFWLANNDPATFPNPDDWDADRHLDTDEQGNDVGKWGAVMSDLGIFGLDEGRDLSERTCLAFVAGALALYEFEPADSKGWKIPKAEFAAGVALPKEDLRVKILRRVLAAK